MQLRIIATAQNHTAPLSFSHKVLNLLTEQSYLDCEKWLQQEFAVNTLCPNFFSRYPSEFINTVHGNQNPLVTIFSYTPTLRSEHPEVRYTAARHIVHLIEKQLDAEGIKVFLFIYTQLLMGHEKLTHAQCLDFIRDLDQLYRRPMHVEQFKDKYAEFMPEIRNNTAFINFKDQNLHPSVQVLFALSCGIKHLYCEGSEIQIDEANKPGRAYESESIYIQEANRNPGKAQSAINLSRGIDHVNQKLTDPHNSINSKNSLQRTLGLLSFKIKGTAKVFTAFTLGFLPMIYICGLGTALIITTLYGISTFVASSAANIFSKHNLAELFKDGGNKFEFNVYEAIENIFYSGLSMPILFLVQQLFSGFPALISIVILSLVNIAWNNWQRKKRGSKHSAETAEREYLRAPAGFAAGEAVEKVVETAFGVAGGPWGLLASRATKDAITYFAENGPKSKAVKADSVTDLDELLKDFDTSGLNWFLDRVAGKQLPKDRYITISGLVGLRLIDFINTSSTASKLALQKRLVEDQQFQQRLTDILKIFKNKTQMKMIINRTYPAMDYRIAQLSEYEKNCDYFITTVNEVFKNTYPQVSRHQVTEPQWALAYQ